MKRTALPRFSSGLLLTGLFLLPCPASTAKAGPDQAAQVISDANGKPVLTYKNSVALVIYVDKYAHWRPLLNTKSEALHVKQALEGQGFYVKLVDNPRDYYQLNSEIHEFSSYYLFRKDVDRVVVFFTGHGFSRRDVGFLIPADTPNPKISATGDDPAFYSEALPMEELYQRVANIFQAKHILIVLDSCNSGSIFANKAAADALIAPSSPALIANPSRQVLTAGSANEEVPAQSVFTPLFVQALSGSADQDKNGYITGSEIASYILREMPVKHLPQYPQSPQYGRIYRASAPAQPQGEILFSTRPATALAATRNPSSIIQDDAESLRRRSQYSVEYFGSSRVNDGRLVQIVLKKLGFKNTPLAAVQNANMSDSIWVGGRVDIGDVKLLANTLIQDGIRLKAIRTFGKTAWHPNPEALQKIQIGADLDLPSTCKPLTIAQIQNATKIDRTTLVCGP